MAVFTKPDLFVEIFDSPPISAIYDNLKSHEYSCRMGRYRQYSEPVPTTAHTYKPDFRPDFRYKSSPYGERYTLRKGKLYYVETIKFLGAQLDFVPVERNEENSNLSLFDINRYVENISVKATPFVVMFLGISELLCESEYLFDLRASYGNMQEKEDKVEVNKSVKVLHENKILKILLADFKEVKF